MAFFTATAKQAGYALAILAVIDIILALCITLMNKYDVSSCAVTVVLDVIVLLAGIGVAKKNSKAYYLALVFVILGFLGSIAEILSAAGLFTVGGVACDWITAICNLVVTGIMLGVLYFNKKEILS